MGGGEGEEGGRRGVREERWVEVTGDEHLVSKKFLTILFTWLK